MIICGDCGSRRRLFMHNEFKTLIWVVAIAVCVTVAVIYRFHGANVRSAKTSSAVSSSGTDGTKWESPLGNKSEDWGYLPLRIKTAFENQRPLEVSPWHAGGGEWTFFECAFQNSNAAVVIGVHTVLTTGNKISMDWGEAILAAPDSNSAELFLKSLSGAFHQQLPKRRMGHPQGFFKMRTAVFGSNLNRIKEGGFSGKGNWSATKWFLEEDGREAEVFFNFSIADKQAEFSEKDPDYREDLVSLLTTALCDGPLPERTLENDPTLTPDGPTFTDWKKLGTGDSSQPSLDRSGSRIYFVERRAHKGPSILYAAQVDHPEQSSQIASIEHQIASYSALGVNDGNFLVVEQIPEREDQTSSADPQILWLVTAGSPPKHLEGPWGDKGWYLTNPPSSPDGRFITVGKWRTEKKKRSNTLYCFDLESGKSVSFDLQGEPIDHVKWEPGAAKPEFTIITGFKLLNKNDLHAFLADPITGGLRPAALVGDSNGVSLVSPDGARTAVLEERSRLLITDKEGKTVVFNFQEYDQRFAQEGSLEWASPRYLLFHASRPAFINADTLKMNFPLPKADATEPELFTPDFSFVIAHRDNGLYIGKISLHN